MRARHSMHLPQQDAGRVARDKYYMRYLSTNTNATIRDGLAHDQDSLYQRSMMETFGE
jgi:hypothetical protein